MINYIAIIPGVKTVEFLHVKSHLVHSLKTPTLWHDLYSVLETQTCKTCPCHSFLMFCTWFPIHLEYFPLFIWQHAFILHVQHKGHFWCPALLALWTDLVGPSLIWTLLHWSIISLSYKYTRTETNECLSSESSYLQISRVHS